MSIKNIPLLPLSKLIPSFIVDNRLYKNENARATFFAIGATYSFIKLLKVGSNIFNWLAQVDRDLGERYGHNSWALITGASDGIGKAYAFELAKRGFNIVLLGRNPEKLQKVEAELKRQYTKIKTRIIVRDFSKSYEEGWAETLSDEIKDLDVSILINNAGQAIADYYMKLDIEKIRNLILTNCLGHALITRVMLPKLEARAQRSAIINTASTAASYPRPINQVYSASKIFHDYLSRGLVYEHPKIDILSVRPGMVTTKMTDNKSPDIKTILPEELVQIALKALGKTDYTHGHIKHQWKAFVGINIPSFLRKYYFKKVFDMKEV